MSAVYRVYVLQNRADKFYIGLTTGVAKRLAEHNAGRSRWTRGKAHGSSFGKAKDWR